MNKKLFISLLCISFVLFGCATSSVEETSTAEEKSTVKGDSPLAMLKSGKKAETMAAFEYAFSIDDSDEDGNTILHIAAMNDDADLCTFFIIKGADPELKNNDSDTPLHLAIKNNCEAAAKAITAMNCDCLFSRDAEGKTALDLGLDTSDVYYDMFITTKAGELRDTDGQSIVHYFVKTQNYKAIRECVKKGIPISVKDSEGKTPLDIAFENLRNDLSVKIAAELILGGADEVDTEYSYFQDAVASRNYNTRLEDGQTPLHLAAILGHTPIANYLLENNASPSVQDSSGATPLHEAVRYGNLQIARSLLDAGADVNATDNLGKAPIMLIFPKEKMLETYQLLVKYRADMSRKDMFGDTILHTATMIGVEPEVITFLIQSGAEVDAKNKEGSTALCIAVQKKQVEIVKMLVQNGADIHTKDANGKTPLILALTNVPEMLEAIITPQNVLSQDSEGNTPLHIALLNDASLSRVKYLLNLTTDVNIRNRDGNSPLFITVLKNRKDVGEALLAKNADIFSANTNNNSPLRIALKYGSTVPTVRNWLITSKTISSTDGSGNTVLHYAAEWQYADAIEFLLEKGADISAKNANGETVLFSAAKSNNPDIIQKVVDGGADIYARDNLGSNAVHIAVRWDAVNSVQKLLDFGLDVNAQNNSGKSPLSEAVLSGKLDIAKLLLKRGANPNSCDITGVTILMDSIRGCNEVVVQLLLKSGANPNVQDINGRNAYHEAAFMGDQRIIKLIRNAGGNPLARDKKGMTPLSIVINQPVSVVMDILGTNKNITDSDGNTPLHIAIKEKASVELVQKFVTAGYPLDSRNSSGYTALNMAIENNNMEYALILLESGANPFQMIDNKGKNGVTVAIEQNNKAMLENIVTYAGKKSDVQGNTVLHYAAKSADEDIVKYLLEQGLNKDVKNVSGDTPLMIAERWRRRSDPVLNLLK